MGDRIISVSGVDLKHATHEQAVDVIRKAQNPVVFVVQSIHSFSPQQVLFAMNASSYVALFRDRWSLTDSRRQRLLRQRQQSNLYRQLKSLITPLSARRTCVVPPRCLYRKVTPNKRTSMVIRRVSFTSALCTSEYHFVLQQKSNSATLIWTAS